MNEWPLFIFTICMQAAIGGVLMIAMFYKQFQALGDHDPYTKLRTPLAVLAGISLIGLLASFAHLGTPAHAFYAMSNLETSWLSREILTTSIFIGALCLTVLLAFVQKRIQPILIWVAVIAGVFELLCMSESYISSLISEWSSLYTLSSFYGASLVLGPLLVARLTFASTDEKTKLYKKAFILSFIGIVLSFIGLIASGMEGHFGLILTSWIIEAIGVCLLAYSAFSKKAIQHLAYLTLAVLFLAVGMSRYAYFLAVS